MAGKRLDTALLPTLSRDELAHTLEMTPVRVAHLEDTGETGKGEGYDQTKYSATLNLIVPAVCPCCAE